MVESIIKQIEKFAKDPNNKGKILTVNDSTISYKDARSIAEALSDLVTEYQRLDSYLDEKNDYIRLLRNENGNLRNLARGKN